MVRYEFRIDDKDAELIEVAAKAARLPVAAWLRSVAVRAAEPKADPNAPRFAPGGTPLRKDGTLIKSRMTIDDWLNSRSIGLGFTPFPSGQRRYAYVYNSQPKLAEDENLHKALEEDYVAAGVGNIPKYHEHMHAYIRGEPESTSAELDRKEKEIAEAFVRQRALSKPATLAHGERPRLPPAEPRHRT